MTSNHNYPHSIPALRFRRPSVQIFAGLIAIMALVAPVAAQRAGPSRSGVPQRARPGIPVSRQTPPTPAPAAPVAPSAAAPFAGSATIAGSNSMADLNDVYPLAVGDRVSYRVLEDGNPPSSLIVTDSGEMEVPLVGRVRGVNKTCKALAFEIKAGLEREFFKRATVLIGVDIMSPQQKRNLGKVLITGAVRSQGELALPGDEPLTVSRAILQMGGFAEFANEKSVEIIRKGEKNQKKRTLKVDVGKVLKGKSDDDPVLQKGDHVIVSEKFFNF